MDFGPEGGLKRKTAGLDLKLLSDCILMFVYSLVVKSMYMFIVPERNQTTAV